VKNLSSNEETIFEKYIVRLIGTPNQNLLNIWFVRFGGLNQ